jgi:hypothetical protein
MKNALIILLMIVVSVATTNCGHVGPTSPSGPQSVTVAPVNATGQVVSIESLESGISDVVISSLGVREAHTDAGGFFTLDANRSAYPLLLTHPDFIDRRTAAVLPANGLHLSMIPSTFDRAAFEEFAPRATTTGLRRWIENPSLIVLTNVVDYDGVAFDPLVTNRQVPDADFACMLDGVRRAIAPMSDNVMTFTKVDVVSPSTGSRFSIPSTPEGTIVLVVARGLLANGRAATFAGVQPNVLVRGVVWVSADNLPLCGSTASRVYPHELGHALGYQHVTLEPSVMSGIQPTSALTLFDRDAIRIVYQRPPGNRSPDVDPPTYVIN